MPHVSERCARKYAYLFVFRETVLCLESKEGLGENCALHHRLHPQQFCFNSLKHIKARYQVH